MCSGQVISGQIICDISLSSSTTLSCTIVTTHINEPFKNLLKGPNQNINFWPTDSPDKCLPSLESVPCCRCYTALRQPCCGSHSVSWCCFCLKCLTITGHYIVKCLYHYTETGQSWDGEMSACSPVSTLCHTTTAQGNQTSQPASRELQITRQLALWDTAQSLWTDWVSRIFLFTYSPLWVKLGTFKSETIIVIKYQVGN